MTGTMLNNLLTAAPSLLAQAQKKSHTMVDRDKLEEISRLHNEGVKHDLPWELLLVGLGVMLVAIVAVSLRRWWHARQDDPSPLVLYSAIARKAGLGWADRFVLWRIAKRFDLPTPIALLLSRGTMRHYTAVYLSNRSGTARQKLADRFSRIEAELFG